MRRSALQGLALPGLTSAPRVAFEGLMSKSPIRPQNIKPQPNGIGAVASLALGDPDIIALWFGETDLVTPAFIREAAKQALDEGRTFYTNARGITPLREAIRGFHTST